MSPSASLSISPLLPGSHPLLQDQIKSLKASHLSLKVVSLSVVGIWSTAWGAGYSRLCAQGSFLMFRGIREVGD